LYERLVCRRVFIKKSIDKVRNMFYTLFNNKTYLEDFMNTAKRFLPATAVTAGALGIGAGKTGRTARNAKLRTPSTMTGITIFV
jgi:hypothetical protein